MTLCQSVSPLCIPAATTGHDSPQARLIVEAECTTCGRVGDEDSDGILIVRFALAHSAATGHVVILNGTTDLPDMNQPNLFA